MRRVCVFTGSRADYGPLLALIHALEDDPEIELSLIVSGGHLVADQGMTVRQIEADGFRIDERVEMVLASDTATGAAKSFALGVIGCAEALDRVGPDLLILLGDRYEALAAAVTASMRLLPIAHISGGELSYGSTDDSARHAITKLAHLHFTANEEFRQRVIQMGERPETVHSTGVPSLDTIRSAPLLGRPELERRIGMELRDPVIVVTYHPATADPDGSRDGLVGLLTALDRVPDASVVFTATNVDRDGSSVAAAIRAYGLRHASRVSVVSSLGQTGYLSLVKQAAMVVGNSSSGLVEAPALQTPTVNIGTRQDGRPRATSVIDCGEQAEEIESAIRLALTPGHQALARSAVSPFGDGRAAARIVAIVKNVELGSLQPKTFADRGCESVNRPGGQPRRGLPA